MSGLLSRVEARGRIDRVIYSRSERLARDAGRDPQ